MKATVLALLMMAAPLTGVLSARAQGSRALLATTACPVLVPIDTGYMAGTLATLRWGDGTETTDTLPARHTYAAPGVYQVQVSWDTQWTALYQAHVVRPTAPEALLLTPQGRCGPHTLMAGGGRYALPGYRDAAIAWRTPGGRDLIGDTITPDVYGVYQITRTGPGGCPLEGSFRYEPFADTGSIAIAQPTGLDRTSPQLVVYPPEPMQVILLPTYAACDVRWLINGQEQEVRGTRLPYLPRRSGRYTFRAQYQGSDRCRYEAERTIDIETDLLYNVVTPNGDGLNDWFIEPGSRLKATIHGRWGQLVREPSSKEGWPEAGTPAGLYYYTSQLGTGPVRRGWVEVVR